MNIPIDKYNLKDCPCCGHSAIISDEGYEYYYVGCGGENCHVMPSLAGENVKDMIKQWNIRHIKGE